MSLSTQPYKGARDFYPEDKRLQKWMFSKWREVAERFGYEEYDAPILEPTELYASKTSDEIVNEQTYSFTDRGGREVTIRTEMTPTVSRMVAGRRQELAYPVRWYSIPNLWRYERPQRGRLREFWQLNVDLFGADGTAADFEMLQMADAIMKSFGAQSAMYRVRINNRKLVNSLLKDYLALNDVQAETAIRLIDRMNKIDRSEFIAKLDAVLAPGQRENGTEKRLFELLNIREINLLPAELLSLPAAQSIKDLLKMAETANILNIEFDMSLMRGFDYYTDMVFEVFDMHPENNRSMFGGGRYDGLVGLFGVDPVATIGFGMGDAPLINFLSAHDLMPQLYPETEVYVVVVDDALINKALKITKDLREMEVNVALDVTGRKIDKQIKAAVKKGVRYALFVGEKELETGQFTLRNLQNGSEETHSLERLVTIIKDRRIIK